MADLTIGDLTPKGSDFELDDLLEISSDVKQFLVRTDEYGALEAPSGVPNDTYLVETDSVLNPSYDVTPNLEMVSISFSFGVQSESVTTGATGSLLITFEDDSTFTFDTEGSGDKLFDDYVENDPNPDPTFTSPSYDVVANISKIAIGLKVKSFTITCQDTGIGDPVKIWNLQLGHTSHSISGHDLIRPDGPYGRLIKTGDLVYSADDLSTQDYVKVDGSILLQSEEPDLFEKIGYLGGVPTAPSDIISGTPTLDDYGNGCAFSPDGQYLAIAHSGSPGLTVLNTSDWSVVSGTPIFYTGGYGCAFSPDGSYLAVVHSGSPGLTVLSTSDWSVVSGTPTLDSHVYGCSFSPDGSYLAAVHLGSPYLTIIDTSDWSVVSGTPTLAGVGYGCAFSPDGQHLAIAHSGSPYLTVIDTSDWSVVSGTPTLGNYGYGCAFSPDGSYLAVAHWGSPYLTVLNTSDWSVVSGTPTLTVVGYGCAFSPDGSYLAAVHLGSPYLTVIDTSDWSVVSGTPTLPDVGNGCSFSPDGSYLAVGHNGSPYLTILMGSIEYSYNTETEFKLPTYDNLTFDEGVSAWLKK